MNTKFNEIAFRIFPSEENIKIKVDVLPLFKESLA